LTHWTGNQRRNADLVKAAIEGREPLHNENGHKNKKGAVKIMHIVSVRMDGASKKLGASKSKLEV